jgi:ABC-2 type transport system ATP-binding protein
LTLQVSRGEVFGFLGPNGAGKTTTLKLLMQLIYPTSGRAEILGRPVGDLSVKRRIGYLPEHPYFYDYLTPRNCSSISRHSSATRLPSGRGRASRLLDDVGIGAERRLQLRKFSKGMMQRVGIAQALINRSPKWCFSTSRCRASIRSARREIREMILAAARRRAPPFSLQLRMCFRMPRTLCSRVAIMAKGRLVTAGALADMLAFQAAGWELVVSVLPMRFSRRQSAR